MTYTQHLIKNWKVAFHALHDFFAHFIHGLIPAIKIRHHQPERPTGEWIQKPRYEDDEYPDVQPNLECPFCGYEIGWCDMGNYCARCGADLKGGAV
jgi:hypothetical protein